MSTAIKAIAEPAYILFPAARQTKKIICVLGVARGGTSMVAGLLRLSGVPMGTTIDPNNNEDQEFLIHKGDRATFVDAKRVNDRNAYLRKISSAIGSRNSEFNFWGWKDPLAHFYVKFLKEQLQNVNFIVVTRDVAAVALREGLEAQGLMRSRAMIDSLMLSVGEYGSIFSTILAMKRPTLLLSYERALRWPEATSKAVFEFVHGNQPAEMARFLEAAAGYIRPDARSGDVSSERPQDSTGVPTSMVDNVLSDLLVDARKYWELLDSDLSSADKSQFSPEFLELFSRFPAVFSRSDTQHMVWLKQMYQAGAHALNSGKIDHALIISRHIIFVLSLNNARLALGPTMIPILIDEDDPALSNLPVEYFANFFIVGMSQLLHGSIKSAYQHFRACYLGLQFLLVFEGEDALASSLVPAAILHCALAAKRQDLKYCIPMLYREMLSWVRERRALSQQLPDNIDVLLQRFRDEVYDPGRNDVV